MRNRTATYRLKGFTIAELLVVLALTSISITLSYGTLNYVQKLFSEYKKQNKFLNEFTDLKNRLDYESLKADIITEQQENEFVIIRDSALSTLQFHESVVLLKQQDHCDTFHFTAKNIKKQYESMRNPLWKDKLLSKLNFDVEFTKQTFHFCFYKQHAAATKLKLDEEKITWQE